MPYSSRAALIMNSFSVAMNRRSTITQEQFRVDLQIFFFKSNKVITYLAEQSYFLNVQSLLLSALLLLFVGFLFCISWLVIA